MVISYNYILKSSRGFSFLCGFQAEPATVRPASQAELTTLRFVTGLGVAQRCRMPPLDGVFGALALAGLAAAGALLAKYRCHHRRCYASLLCLRCDESLVILHHSYIL